MLRLTGATFRKQNDAIIASNTEAFYSPPAVEYGQGPALDRDNILELPIAKCGCGKSLFAIGGKFISEMQKRQQEKIDTHKRKMTVEEFSSNAKEVLDIVSPPTRVKRIRGCCLDTIEEAGNIDTNDAASETSFDDNITCECGVN